MKRVFSLLLAILLIAGCTDPNHEPGDLTWSDGMPPPLQGNGMLKGEFEAQLYFLSEDGQNLVPQTRVISISGCANRAEAVIRAMIAGPEDQFVMPSISAGLTLERVELSVDACNVYFSGDFPGIMESWLTTRAAVAAAVKDAEGIPAVNIYFDGAEPGYAGRALGAMEPISEALGVYLMNVKHEYEVLADDPLGEAGSIETQIATLYFASYMGKFFMAKNSVISYSRTANIEDIAILLMSKLREGDSSRSGFGPVLPADFKLKTNPQIEGLPLEEEEAYRDFIISIEIERPQLDYAIDVMCGALTLTLTGYIPNCRGVRLAFTDEDGTAEHFPPSGYYTRKDFSDRVGYSIDLSYPDANGQSLHRVDRAVPSAAVYDPMLRLSELFISPADPGVMYPFFVKTDIQSVYIIGSLAVVDWRAGFSDKLRALIKTNETTIPKDRRERLFVYSVVNTLTELPGVSRVWMLENGKKLGLADKIYLGNALLRNPGILADE